MKKIIIIVLTLCSVCSFAQEKASDLFSIKAGLIGAWISYEKSFSSEMTIVGEAGYQGGLFYNSLIDNQVNYVFTTNLSLEGRYYYNFDRRIEKGKNTKNNSANYLALEADYTPDWGTSSNATHINVLRTFSIISKYGLRRNISNQINFEFAFGPGYQWVENNDGGVILGIDIRFGFNF